MNLRDLDLLPYSEKIWHFSCEKPWEARRGKAVKGQYRKVTIPMGSRQPFFWSDIVTDGFGNVLAMPKLIGRPCFGIVTAFVRHGSMEPIYIRRTRKEGQPRCGRCPVQSACHNLAKDRIYANGALLAAYERWKLSGGRKMFNSHLQLHASRSSFTSLVQLAKTTVFLSSNDQIVSDHYRRIAAELLEKDRNRQREARKKSRLSGIVDLTLVKQSLEERHRRKALLDAAINDQSRPYWMSKLGPNSSAVIADAWLAQYLLGVARKRPTPGRVAKAMMARTSYHGWNKDTLRARLRNDLARVAQLESLILRGEQNPVWDRFDPP